MNYTRVKSIRKIQKQEDLLDITTSSGDFFAGGVLVHNCDAFYTWSPNSEEFWTEGRYLSFQECAELIDNTWGTNSYNTGGKRVVFTGGEPLVQKKQIEHVMWRLFKKGPWAFEIETNGTLMPTEDMLFHCTFNCSPKLRNSNNKEYSMVKPKVLHELNNAKTTFKFVCRDKKDLEEIEELYVPYIDQHKIIIMPEGIVEEEITKHARQLIGPVLKRGWRMTPRFQAIFADGARRGV